MTDKKKAKQEGQLFWRDNGGWYGRWYATVEGERIRIARALGTDSKPVARRRLDRLIAQAEPQPTVEAVKREETFEEAARRIVERQRREIATASDRLQRLRDYAFAE